MPPTRVKNVVPRTGSTSIVDGWFRLDLDWIPCGKKNRTRSMYNASLGRIMHFPDALVVKDTEAIRRIVHAPAMPTPNPRQRWRVRWFVYRPLSAAERKTGVWNQRRGDYASAHEIVIDALNELIWEDDSQIVATGEGCEDRTVDRKGFRLEAQVIQ